MGFDVSQLPDAGLAIFYNGPYETTDFSGNTIYPIQYEVRSDILVEGVNAPDQGSYEVTVTYTDLTTGAVISEATPVEILSEDTFLAY